MARQHGNPILLPSGGAEGIVLARNHDFSEASIQELIHAHPEVLPISEIEPAYEGAISICRELNTPAGPIDNFLLTPSGLPVLVECKLWRNPQARREVVGQVLDYAKELARWSSSDVQREAARKGVPSIVEKVREQCPDLDEAAFHDTLTASLERGRCLLLIVGDGIREGVEAIFEHLHDQGALQFSFGLVEMPIFDLPDGAQLALPRVLTRIPVEVRRVTELPQGLSFEEIGDEEGNAVDLDTQALGDDRQTFWESFLKVLRLDDPEQPIPRAPRQGYIYFILPAPSASAWLTVYRDIRKGEVGIFLNSTRGTVGERAVDAIMADWDAEKTRMLGGRAYHDRSNPKKPLMDKLQVGDLSDGVVRAQAVEWLAERTNAFVNVLRPAIRSAVADMEEVDD